MALFRQLRKKSLKGCLINTRHHVIMNFVTLTKEGIYAKPRFLE